METRDHRTATPFPNAPRFFRRVWDPAVETARVGGPRRGLFVFDERLVIYGFSSRSSYREDWPVEDGAWESRRAFPSVCFSPREPEGEYGFTRLDAVEEITEAEFVAAREKGWPQ